MVIFSGNDKSIILYCAGEGHCVFNQANMDRQNKVIYDMLPDDRPLKFNGTQHIIEEELGIFRQRVFMIWLN